MSQIEPQENVDYDDPLESISNDAVRLGLSNEQIWAVWQAGLAAQPSVQRTATCAHGIPTTSMCPQCGDQWPDE